MKRQPTWDKYEVALLIDCYINIKNGNKDKIEALQELSNHLRTKAINEGMEIDGTFRNLNGMQWQIGFIDCAFRKTGYGKHMPSKLFQSMVDMYLSDREKFEKILYEAKQKIIVDFSDMDTNEFKDRRDGLMDGRKNDYIRWLEKNSELKYPIDTIVHVMDECSSYAVTHKISKMSLWNIENVKVFESVSSRLISDHIFKVIQRKTAQIFEKSRGYYSKFLSENVRKNVCEKNVTLNVKEGDKNTLRTDYEIRLVQLVSNKFTYGFRLGSVIELMKLKEYAKEEDIDINASDEELEKIIKRNGFVSNGKVFVIDEVVKGKLDEILGEDFSQDISVIYYECFMEKHREWLESNYIVTEDILKEFLVMTRKDLFFSKNFISNNGKINENIAVTNEICRIWGDKVKLSVEEISDKLPYIPIEKIKFYLSESRLFAWVSEGVYTYVRTLIITQEEELEIVDFVNYECETNGFVLLRDIPLGDIIEQNYELPQSTILIAVYNRILSEEFHLNGKIVTKEKTDIDVVTLMKQFCTEKDECTLDEAINKVNELTGNKNRGVTYQALYDIMIRVSEQKFVSDRQVHFDIDAIDGAIDSFVKDGFAAVREVTTFALFPICGKTWNYYLLESYCHKYSKKYRYRTNLYNGRNAGAIVSCKIDWDYKELLSHAVARANIKLEKEIIGKYLFETGYMARSKFNWLDDIAEKAKQIREDNT